MKKLDKEIDAMIDEIKNPASKKVYIYESPDKGKTVYRREFGTSEKELVTENN
jgi:hypothetical protein